MNNLLTKKEKRWFHFVELLTDSKDWMILEKLASLLDCSTRILKNDIVYLNDTYDDFVIETSNRGIRIHYQTNHNFKTFSQKILMHSDSYRILELIFLHHPIKVQDISKELDISLSTLYRMIDQLNKKTRELYHFEIETNPCDIVGSEKDIRYFFSTYFFERYRHIQWPFEQINENRVDLMIKEFIRLKEIPGSFVYFNVIKILAIVNYIRYKNNHFAEVETDNQMVESLFFNEKDEKNLQALIEKTFNVTYDQTFITQVFGPFVQINLYYTFDRFLEAVNNDASLKIKMIQIRDVLEKIANKNDIHIPNVRKVAYALYTAMMLECYDPQANYILFDRNAYFAKDIQNEFPAFYQDLYDGIVEIRKVMNKELTDTGIYYNLYTAFSWWQDLVPELQQNLNRIKVLIISDRHKSHAKMMKDFIDFEFSEQLAIDVSDTLYVDPEIINASGYEMIISSYMDETLNNYRTVYIPNIPQTENFLLIQEQIETILRERQVQ